MKKFVLLLTFNFMVVAGFSQVGNLSIDEIYKNYRDSISNSDYPWHLPILGGKLREMGFDLPYPNGFMVTYGHSSQHIMIYDLSVGLGADNLVNVDRLARFNGVDADVNALIVKYDFYILPFLNVFGLAGRIESTSDINLGLPFEMTFQTKASASTSVGWGFIVAGGIGPIVLASNFVQNWTFVSSLDEPATSINVDARVGYMARFRKRPDRNIVFLVGANYLGVNENSSGKLDFEKLLGITPDKKQIASEQLDGWYGDLTDPGKEIFGGLYDGLSGWLNNDEPVNLHYDFDKRLYYPMSMTLGANFQLNPRYQFNAIYTFLGSRQQFTFGISYRFGFKGKNYLRGMTL